MAIDKQCAQYCIQVIRSVMQEVPVPRLPETVSLEDLYAFSKKHGVEAMVFHGMEQLDMDETDPVWLNWQSRANMLLSQSIVQLAERDVLFATLPEAGIQILPVKGCWLKELYPQIDYRQMSDLDILIREEDIRRAGKCMQSLGYIAEAETVDNHDCFAKPPYMEVELHHALLQKGDQHYHYYDAVWEKAVSVDGYPGVARLKAEDEYIYYLLHLRKHILGSGTGLRTILDCVVYRKLYPDMDREYLTKEWKQLDLLAFAQQIETLSDCWFRTGTPVAEELRDLAAAIMDAGSYGTYEILCRQRLENLQKKYRKPIVRAAAYWVIQICRPKEEMEHRYPVVKKATFLLPIFWIVRAVSKFASHPKGVLQHIRTVFGRVKKDD